MPWGAGPRTVLSWPGSAGSGPGRGFRSPRATLCVGFSSFGTMCSLPHRRAFAHSCSRDCQHGLELQGDLLTAALGITNRDRSCRAVAHRSLQLR